MSPICLNIKIAINVMQTYSVGLREDSTYKGNKSIAF